MNTKPIRPVNMGTLFGDWYPPPMPMANGSGAVNMRTGEATGPVSVDQMNGWLERNGTRQPAGILPNAREPNVAVPYSTNGASKSIRTSVDGISDEDEEILEIESIVVPAYPVPPSDRSANGYAHMNGSVQSPGGSMTVKRLIGAQELRIFFPSVEQRRQVCLLIC